MEKYRFTDDDYKELERQLNNRHGQGGLLKFLDGGGMYTISIVANQTDILFYNETLYNDQVEAEGIYQWFKYMCSECTPVSDFDKERAQKSININQEMGKYRITDANYKKLAKRLVKKATDEKEAIYASVETGDFLLEVKAILQRGDSSRVIIYSELRGDGKWHQKRYGVNEGTPEPLTDFNIRTMERFIDDVMFSSRREA